MSVRTLTIGIVAQPPVLLTVSLVGIKVGAVDSGLAEGMKVVTAQVKVGAQDTIVTAEQLNATKFGLLVAVEES